ncbi:cytochrome c oxidase subunit 4 [Streptomyces pseudogriseolus]|uniref:aa3-type cytochrome oxidase subunit IV n=1 Tax=Streptomyces pseudogriseolus TaxID=36817 RepID=UPI00346A6AE7
MASVRRRCRVLDGRRFSGRPARGTTRVGGRREGHAWRRWTRARGCRTGRRGVRHSGVSLFFAVSATTYGPSSAEPAGTAALVVSCLMSALVAFFLWYRHRKDGLLPKDRKGASVHEAAGPVAFFPPRSAFPVLAAAGTALLGLGAVYGLWLFLIGAGVLVPGVLGFVFQYAARGTDPVRPTGVEDR